MTLANTWTQANTVQQVYPDTSDEHVSYVMWKCVFPLCLIFRWRACCVRSTAEGMQSRSLQLLGVCIHALRHM